MQERCAGALVFRKLPDEQEGRKRFELLMIRNKLGFWAFPKGHQEQGERLEDTAVREVEEETGVSCRLLPRRLFLEKVLYFSSTKSLKEVNYFLARPAGGELQKQEGETLEVAFVPGEEVAERLSYPTDRELWSKGRRTIYRFLKGNQTSRKEKRPSPPRSQIGRSGTKTGKSSGQRGFGGSNGGK